MRLHFTTLYFFISNVQQTLFYSLLLLALAARTTYQETLDRWVGATEKELVREFGAPQSSYEVEGSRFLKFERAGQYVVPPTPVTYETMVVKNRAYTRAYGGSGC
ncbi:hypothetical protein DC082_10300 [Ignatzschineria indica]|uniref:Uncharacterized protein n=1 Tax=Ignatzschineria indica TaxID=472583 RepID=A0A2U2AHR4_9GAMM|nr:hypothetical protein DC082_10300 [Ignatzschineria indica]